MEFPISKEIIKYVSIIAITLSVAFIVIRISRFLLDRFFIKSSEIIRYNPTNFQFFKNAISLIIFSLALFFIFYSIPELKSLGLTLFAGAGIFAAILGFASQQAFSNIISGVFIVIFKPFSVGDFVKVGTEKSGVIEDITLRHTIIRNFENRRFVIPNSVISAETVLNSSITDDRTCNHIEIGISYDSDIDKAMNILAEEVENHPNNIDYRDPDIGDKAPRVLVRVISLADFSVILRAWAWAEDSPSAFVLKCDVLKSTKERFDREGIEIPFPYRTIVYKKDI